MSISTPMPGHRWYGLLTTWRDRGKPFQRTTATRAPIHYYIPIASERREYGVPTKTDDDPSNRRQRARWSVRVPVSTSFDESTVEAALESPISSWTQRESRVVQTLSQGPRLHSTRTSNRLVVEPRNDHAHRPVSAPGLGEFGCPLDLGSRRLCRAGDLLDARVLPAGGVHGFRRSFSIHASHIVQCFKLASENIMGALADGRTEDQFL